MVGISTFHGNRFTKFMVAINLHKTYFTIKIHTMFVMSEVIYIQPLTWITVPMFLRSSQYNDMQHTYMKLIKIDPGMYIRNTLAIHYQE